MDLSRLDFTLEKYEALCESTINSGYIIKTVSSYLSYLDRDKNDNKDVSDGNYVIIRHDVDRMIDKAVRMANLEYRKDIKTTYYFRKSGFLHRGRIKAISEMGHEIGYHYEVLDEAKGNNELAIKFFEAELDELRQIADVKTICMHGNPLTKWVNRDLWKYYDYRNYGLQGEAYLSLPGVPYFSDTGRIWDNSRKIKDISLLSLAEKNKHQDRVVNTDDLIRLINKHGFTTLYLTVHPNRWSNNLVEWVIDQAIDTGTNMIKYILRVTRNHESIQS
jgi:hypothetical protein